MNETAPDASDRRCANCGTPLTGRYCSACGQEDHSLAVPLHRLILDFLSDQFQFDSRIGRTLGLLLFRPGRLTRNYLAGERQRYIPPIRLYLFISIVFFLIIGLVPVKVGDMVHMGNTARTGSPPAGTQAPPAIRWLATHVESAKAKPGEFWSQFRGNMPRVLFFLIPVFALLLKLLYLLRKRFYSEHLIFALHYHSMLFLYLLAVVGLVAAAGIAPAGLAVAARWLAAAIGAWSVAYLVPAVRAVYGGGWWGALWRASLLWWVYFMALASGTVGAVMVTLAMA